MKNEKNLDYGRKVFQMDEKLEFEKIPIFFWKKMKKNLKFEIQFFRIGTRTRTQFFFI